MFAIVTEEEGLDKLPDKLGGFHDGLFVKPEHGYDSEQPGAFASLMMCLQCVRAQAWASMPSR